MRATRDFPEPSIILCHAGSADSERLAGALDPIGRVEQARSLAQAVEMLAFSAADCLIVDVPPDRQARAVLGRITAAYPETRILVLAETVPFEIARDLLRLGVRDVLPLPPDPMTCADAVREALADRGGGAGDLRGMTIAVMSGKGGTGCTVLAVHLAAALASHGVSALVDADAPPFGTVPVAADLDEGSSIAGLICQRLPIEPRLLRRAAVPHPAGFSTLSLWSAPPEAQEIVDSAAAALEALAATYPFVVMDIGRPALPAQRLLLRRASLVVAVATLDLLALRNLRAAADLAAAETGGGLRLLPVLNRCDGEASYTPAQAAAAFGQPFAAVLPYVPAMRACLDHGELLGPSGPDPAWHAALGRLAEQIVSRRREDVRSIVASPALFSGPHGDG